MSVFPAKKRIGLFGGTFDPIHHGHLILARDALELLKLDRLLFLPAKVSPYKMEMPPEASSEDRLAMLHLALEGESRFAVDPRELKREGPSYAIETVKELQEEFPHAAFFYLIGEDHVATLDSWKESSELQKRVAFAVFTRSSHSSSLDFFRNSASLEKGLLLTLPSRRLDISSTEIRERLAKGDSVRYLLPTAVFHYLEKKSLYQPHI